MTGLLDMINEKTGRVHTTFHQTITQTGRLSSTDPNLQNIPVRSELGSNVRRVFVAKEGCVLTDADYSQIELRLLAHISNDQAMTNAFLGNEDIHTATASQVFGVPMEEVTPAMRRNAKAVNFGIVYGIGAFSLAEDLNISRKEAETYIQDYLSTYRGVKNYLDETVRQAEKDGYVTTMFGRRRYLPELASTNRNIHEFGRRCAMNTPIQGAAADIIKIAMAKVYKRLLAENLSSKLILQIHDELIIETKEEEKERVFAVLKEEMERAADLTVPLLCDIHMGKSWFDAKG
ncbi:DNA polymerase I [bioreactor metagenome]|uniref:DNA-directed DNA polymerase n=1 Tax=bioreactor metagenome TaxID=1076179 RepID=A0A645FGT6_9ZZZZ